MEDLTSGQSAALMRVVEARRAFRVRFGASLVVVPVFIAIWFLTFPRDEALACPGKVATEISLADIVPPWRLDTVGVGDGVVLTGAQIRPRRGQALLLCSYKQEAADDRVNLTTNAPLGACSIARDKRGFLCARGTAFSP